MKAVSHKERKARTMIGVGGVHGRGRVVRVLARNLRKVRELVSEEDMGEGPLLANYYAGLPETRV